jgi:ABC-type transport system involved in Fe-S cluster assembly fused permease/ATPase subunit
MEMVPWHKVKEFVKQSYEMTERSYETSRKILEMYEDNQVERIRAMGVVLVHQVVIFLLALAFLFVLLGH